ncbi:non-ribosomal peptide synthetase [Pseudomonas antarctica]|uniref:non-ribosomal peptide synthetase n=1 Tax=Pseudomonas antarctica TaxID=219572 RepID=UPI003F7510DE
MSTAQQGSVDAGLALLVEQQQHLDARQTGASWGDLAHCLKLDIHGELDPLRLQHALDSLVVRHEALAAQFAPVSGYHGLRQRVAAAETVSLTQWTQVASPQQVSARQQHWLQQPLPLVAALLQRLETDHWQLLVGVARHAVDAATLALLQQELLAAYAQQGFAEEEPGQFSQYLEWRSEVIFDEDAETAKAYWQQYLQASEPLVNGPDLPYRLASSDVAPAERLSVPLDQTLLARLRTQGQPLDVLMQAAWWVLLARISGRESFLGGWRHDARQDYEFFSHSLGLFEKTLPLAIHIDPASTFRDLVGTLAAQLDQHRTWQEYWSPLAFPQQAAPAIGFSRRQVSAPHAVAGLVWAGSDLPPRAPAFEFALQLDMADTGEPQAVSLDFNPACYSAHAAETLLGQYRQLLRSIADTPDETVARLNLLDADEKSRLLALNPPAQAMDALLLPQRIAAWASQTPDAVALVAAGQTLSYAALDARTAQLSAELLRQGVSAGSIVGLALPRSVELVVAILATWRAGAAYLPLDPQWPAARQAEIARHAAASLILMAQAPSQGDPLAAFKVLKVAAASLDAPVAQAASVQSRDVAYVLFTSGSTGQPKGVVIEHGALLNYTASSSQQLGLAACRHVAFSSTVAADLGNTALFGALYNGAALHIADDATLQDPEGFAGFLRNNRIDCLKIVPSHLSALLEADSAVLPDTLVLGGEAIGAGLVQRIRQLRPDCRVFNHYGPTEATVGVMVHPLLPGDDLSHGVPLTHVLPGNQVFVLGADAQLLATGELGELFIGGQQLCRGYLNGQADAFIQSPLVGGERLYRTGDLARYRVEGGVQLYGRRDHQVKVRGFRIELAEIEAQLLRFPEVSEAVVVLAHEEPQAFVVLRAAADEALLAQLKTRLAQQLPAAMVPRQVLSLERMPRLPNGKVDRNALQQAQPVAARAVYVAPRDALEELLSTRMAQLVGLERLSIDEDFFAVGGHSLLVIKLVAGIRKLLHCEIHPGVVFDHPSVAELAGVLRARESVPGQLEKIAQARLRLDAMSPEQKAALMEKARQLQASQQ